MCAQAGDQGNHPGIFVTGLNLGPTNYSGCPLNAALTICTRGRNYQRNAGTLLGASNKIVQLWTWELVSLKLIISRLVNFVTSKVKKYNQ